MTEPSTPLSKVDEHGFVEHRPGWYTNVAVPHEDPGQQLIRVMRADGFNIGAVTPDKVDALIDNAEQSPPPATGHDSLESSLGGQSYIPEALTSNLIGDNTGAVEPEGFQPVPEPPRRSRS